MNVRHYLEAAIGLGFFLATRLPHLRQPDLATATGFLTRRNLCGSLAAAASAAVARSQTQDPGPNTARLWVRLFDERGRPTAARIYLTGPDGRPCTPSGSIARQIARTRETFFHAGGGFQIELPAGEATLEVVKGFEYRPVKIKVPLRLGETSAVSLTLQRIVDMPASGWHSGDVHMHPNHVHGGVYMTMEDCLLYAAAEDIRVANLLISSAQSPHVFDTEFFRGGKPEPISTPETLLVVQEEFRNTSAMYGHMPLLGITKLVEPFFTGEPDSSSSEDYPPNYTIALAAKKQGGAVCYTHPADKPGIPVGPHLAREFPIDLALGVVDALDILGNMDEEGGCWMYYRVLNCGLKCTASSGSDSRMDVPLHAVSGGGKVYVKIDGPLTYEKWIAAYKAGRTFVSNGPMLFLDVEGRQPGEEIRAAGVTRLRLSVRAQSLLPMDVVEIIVNGRVAAAFKPPDPARAEFAETIPVAGSSWIAARVWGPGNRLVVNDPRLFAHTSPVYCRVAGRNISSAEDARTVVAWIDRLIEDVASSPRFSSEQHRNEVLELFRKGREFYQRQVVA